MTWSSPVGKYFIPCISWFNSFIHDVLFHVFFPDTVKRRPFSSPPREMMGIPVFRLMRHGNPRTGSMPPSHGRRLGRATPWRSGAVKPSLDPSKSPFPGNRDIRSSLKHTEKAPRPYSTRSVIIMGFPSAAPISLSLTSRRPAPEAPPFFSREGYPILTYGIAPFAEPRS